MQYVYFFAANKVYFTQTKRDHKHILYTKNCPRLSSFLFSAFTSYALHLHIYFTLLLLSLSYFYSDICYTGTVKTCTFCQKVLRKNLQMIPDLLYDCQNMSDRCSKYLLQINSARNQKLQVIFPLAYLPTKSAI